MLSDEKEIERYKYDEAYEEIQIQTTLSVEQITVYRSLHSSYTQRISPSLFFKYNIYIFLITRKCKFYYYNFSFEFLTTGTILHIIIIFSNSVRFKSKQ